MRKFVYLVTLIFLLSMASSASAELNYVYWAGNGKPDVNGVPEYSPAEDEYWSNANNWVTWPESTGWTLTQPYMPTSTDWACVNRGGYTTVVNDGTAAEALQVHVTYYNFDPYTPGNPTLSVTGGTLTVGDVLSVGSAELTCEPGLLLISGGTTNIGTNFLVGGTVWGASGNGIVEMSGGTVNVTGNLRIGMNAGTGDMTLSGGTIEAAALEMTGNGSLVITGDGMILIPTDVTGALAPYIVAGWLQGTAEYSTTGPYAYYTVVTPEPATLALLGMGGLVLLRRKR